MGNPHILVIPYPAQGHVIPLMELSLCLAKYGCKISFLNTGKDGELVNYAKELKGEIRYELHLVSLPDDGPESSKDTRGLQSTSSEAVLRVLPGKVEKLIEEINSSESDKISCILADQSIGWALEIAERKGIPRAAFCPAAAAQLVIGFSIPKLIEGGAIDEDGTPIKRQMIKLSPSMPAINTAELTWACLGNKNQQKNIFGLMVRNVESMKLTDWLLCNSAYELEPGALKSAPQIIAIGPLLAENRLGDSAGSLWQEHTTCLNWLEKQPPQSVIYAAFGSITTFDPTQFQELALGLELTSRPFLWVVRSDTSNDTDNAFFKDFQDRVGTRGKIVTRAPQQKLLAHPSIACFVSHCGWNSTMEGVSNGIPFLCWPYFADQFSNKSYICDAWKIGLGLNKDDRGMITRWEIKSKVDQLLSNGEFRSRALDLQKRVIVSVKEGGTSYKSFIKFVEWIKA